MRIKKFLVTLTSLVISLTTLWGCTTNKTFYGDSEAAPEATSIKPLLESTADSIDNALQMLAATQTPYVSNAINTQPLMTAQGGMGGITSIDWAGPIQPLLEKMAHMTHYKVKIMGNEPPIPIIVSITAKNVAIADIIKNAGLQAGKRANIVIYPSTKIIELRYTVS